jgi:putative transposase
LITRYEPTRPNEFWECDHCLLDILVLDNLAKPARPWLTAIIDKFSRALMGYYLSTESPNSLHTSLALRQAIWHKSRSGWMMCGIPDKLHVDNGADLISKHMKQATLNLKIELIPATPGLPRVRGRVERFFHTINQQFLCELPAYIGNDCKNRPRSVTPKLSLEDFERLLIDYIVDQYHHTPHATTRQTPHARWNQNFIPRMLASLHELDLLLVHVTKSRKVQRDGIHFLNLRYFSDNLIPFIGEEVSIRYDPRDLAVIHVYHHDRLIGKALEPELSQVRMSLREVQALQKKQRSELRKEIREKVSFSKRYLAQLQQNESLNSEEKTRGAESKRRATNLKLYHCD